MMQGGLPVKRRLISLYVHPPSALQRLGYNRDAIIP